MSRDFEWTVHMPEGVACVSGRAAVTPSSSRPTSVSGVPALFAASASVGAGRTGGFPAARPASHLRILNERLRGAW